MSEIDRRINAAIGRLERLAVKIPAAIDALLDQRRKIDGWGTTGEVHVQHTAELTPTEAAVNQRQHIDRQIANLYDELDAIRCIARNIEHDCDRYLATNTPELDQQPKPRCDGGIGRTGYLEWGDPACTNIPEPYRKQCSRCRKAEDRWLVAHGERRHIGNDV